MTHRRTWDDFPPPLRLRLEGLLGEPVARTRSCVGGFSPSSAEILLGASSSAVFVKAVRDRDNPASRALNGAEADVLAAMPATAPVPALVDVFEEGEWFVLVTQAAPGTLPEVPWTPAQLDQVLRSLDDLQAATAPCPVRGLRSVPETLGPDLLGFEHVAAARRRTWIRGSRATWTNCAPRRGEGSTPWTETPCATPTCALTTC